MKKPPTAFLTIVILLLFLFIVIGKMMRKAESDLNDLKKKREREGGLSQYEKDLNALLK